MYTADGTYLRLRTIAPDGQQPRREVDFPDGIRKRFRCVDDCTGRRPRWLLDWVSDPFGNVLQIAYQDATGTTSYLPPANGLWVWKITESTMNNAETVSSPSGQYYDGTQLLTDVRTHYAYFSRPHSWETRLERLALAAPL
jgi:hypothetical protein